MKKLAFLFMLGLTACGGGSDSEPFDGPNISGVWVGSIWNTQGPIAYVQALVSQSGGNLSGTYATSEGGDGPLSGSVSDRGEVSITLSSCEGQFLAEGQYQSDTLTLNVIGEDCAMLIANASSKLHRINPIVDGTYVSDGHVIGLDVGEEVTGFIVTHRFDISTDTMGTATGTISGTLPNLSVAYDNEIPGVDTSEVTLKVNEIDDEFLRGVIQYGSASASITARLLF